MASVRHHNIRIASFSRKRAFPLAFVKAQRLSLVVLIMIRALLA